MKFLIPFFLLALLSCNGCREPQPAVPPANLEEELIRANREKHKQETDRIHEYILREKIPMTETATGLNYWIYKEGTGAKTAKGDVVEIAYTISLLDGKRLYTADVKNPGVFRIGEDNVESGLHEALLLMRVGDKAQIILPSHLAFGFTGDSEKVPQDATLIYDVELLRIQ